MHKSFRINTIAVVVTIQVKHFATPFDTFFNARHQMPSVEGLVAGDQQTVILALVYQVTRAQGIRAQTIGQNPLMGWVSMK
jgi:hypothetical protein